MNLSVHKCGTCIGCQSESAMQRCIAMMDEVVMPKIAAAERTMESARDHRDWRFVEAHRHYQVLHDYRWRYIDQICRQFGWPGCVQMVVRSDAVA